MSIDSGTGQYKFDETLEVFLPRSTSSEASKNEVASVSDFRKVSFEYRRLTKYLYEEIDKVNAKFNDFQQQLEDNSIKLNEQRQIQEEKFEEKLKDQSNKNYEILGLFSAVIALVIIDVNIIKSANSFLSAILLISALTASMSIFAALIHKFFSGKDENLGYAFWIPIIVLVLLIISATVVTYRRQVANIINDIGMETQIRNPDVDTNKEKKLKENN